MVLQFVCSDHAEGKTLCLYEAGLRHTRMGHVRQLPIEGGMGRVRRSGAQTLIPTTSHLARRSQLWVLQVSRVCTLRSKAHLSRKSVIPLIVLCTREPPTLYISSLNSGRLKSIPSTNGACECQARMALANAKQRPVWEPCSGNSHVEFS